MALTIKKKRRLVIILAGVAVLAAALVVLAWQLGFFSPPRFSGIVGTPGAAAGDASLFEESAADVADMQKRVVKLFWSEGGGGLACWYRPAPRIGRPPAEKAGVYLAEDQLRYGQFLLEQGGKKAFLSWWADFKTGYVTREGEVLTYPAGSAEGATPGNWRINGSVLRLLAQSCTLWPDQERLDDLRRLSDGMLSASLRAMPTDYTAAVATAAPALDPAATPTPKPSITPRVSPTALPTLDVIRLASIDLYTMGQLASFDQRWQTLFDRCLPLVEGGYLGDSLPLYALGYDPQQEGYLPFAGEAPAVDTAEALLTILHLAEAGQENPLSLNWIREQIFNQKFLARMYHVAQGTRVGDDECVEGYAIVARIARIKGDRELYDAAADLLLWHQATSSRSEVLSAIYRQDAAGVIEVWASDNTWALLAIG